MTGTTATEVNERKLKAAVKTMEAIGALRPRITMIGLEPFKEFMDKRKKEEIVDRLYSGELE